ncbi:HPr family phosphocarrier protein [Amorphus sp. 3PC139-8]|uniref:HPr family phosphocarrier protein n=1 Tax=Amorphus sp. 3PC139-8 TaxID=2735676 RepID=UPI00345DBC27
MSEPSTAERTATLTIVNQRGLHARASAKFVKCVEAYDAAVTVERDGQSVGGTSIMGLLMLAAGKGTQIVVSASGAEADEAIAALTKLIEDGFGEDSLPGG